MNVEQVRAAFIKRTLQSARTTGDLLLARRIVREFRRYVTWCRHLLTNEDQRSIAEQLSQLEADLPAARGSDARRPPASGR